MRTKGKRIFSTVLIFLLFVVGGWIFLLKGNGTAASAATVGSQSLVTNGWFEGSSGQINSRDPQEYFLITLQTSSGSGNGTLNNNGTINWSEMTVKIEVLNSKKLHKHNSVTLTKDGTDVMTKTLSGNASAELFSVSLSDGEYTLNYNMDISFSSVRYNGMDYVFKFKVDISAPKTTLMSNGNHLSSGGYTNKSITFSASDDNFKYIYYKRPNASSFSTTTNTSYVVDATASNSGLWSFYAADSFGQRTETVTAYLDCLPPTMACSSGVSFGGTTGKTFSISASDAGGAAKLYVKYESEEWFTNGDRYTVPETERDGRYYFYAEDGCGNKTDTKWVILSTEEPVGRIVSSETDNSISFVWDNAYWSATLDGSAYRNGAWISQEGNHSIVLSNNAEKKRTYNFSIDHCYKTKANKNPTCTENGWIKHECLQCGDVWEETIYATGHQYSVQKSPASCTVQGENVYTCSVCGNTYHEPSGAPFGHSYTSHIVKEATCTEDGINESVCDLCGDTVQKKISARGHNYDITEVKTVNGNTRRTYTCSVCGDSYTQELGNQYEHVTTYVEYLFEQYAPYMYWVLLATAGIWSIAIGVAIIIAVRNEDKAKAKKMLVNYLIGLVVIFCIIVACPYLMRGIASLIT